MEILVDYSNNETIQFHSLSQAMMYTLDLSLCEIHALEIHCNDAVSYQSLQNYIEGLNQSIS
jgi:hypothetical protein